MLLFCNPRNLLGWLAGWYVELALDVGSTIECKYLPRLCSLGKATAAFYQTEGFALSLVREQVALRP